MYGKLDAYIDVTQIIRSLFEKGNKMILIENKIFGCDPLRNVKKELIITLPDNSTIIFQERTKVDLEYISSKASKIRSDVLTNPIVGANFDPRETTGKLDVPPGKNNAPIVSDQLKETIGKSDDSPEKNSAPIVSDHSKGTIGKLDAPPEKNNAPIVSDHSRETIGKLDALPEKNNTPIVSDHSKETIGKLDALPEKNNTPIVSDRSKETIEKLDTSLEKNNISMVNDRSKETIGKLDVLPEKNNIPMVNDRSKETVDKLDVLSEKNTNLIFSPVLSTLDNNSIIRNIVFIDTYANNTASHWYMSITNIYKNILKTHRYNIINKQITKSYPIINTLLLDELCKSKSPENIYVMTPLDFAMFVNVHNLLHKEKIYFFLKNLNYVVIWQEILREDQTIVGYNYVDPNFIKFFFGHSLLNLVSNLSSINALEMHSIKHNLYTPAVGYSPINCLTPFENCDTNHSIDVLIYGTLAPNYTHRQKMYDQLNQYNNGQFKMKIITNTFGGQLDLFLKRTKIVVHIPSFDGLQQIPWPKITYLQTHKIFFIIEDNNDLHEKKLDNIIITFNRNDIRDLCNKILYYLNNPPERERIININFEWIKNNFNIDVQIPRIFKNLHGISYPKNTLKTDYAFLDIQYHKCSSHLFYAQLTDKIKNIITLNGGEYRLIKNLKELIPFNTKTILIIDVCILCYLFTNRQSEIKDLFKVKYYLIVGENFDQQSNTLLGWNSKLYNFTKDNILRQSIENSDTVTVQNNRTLQLFTTFNIKNIIYFPIDGYSDKYIINSRYPNKDIDVYYYGWMSERRFNILKSIPHDISILVTTLTFDNDDLIDRAKIILHTNSVDNCYHIPFAKLMKLLTNNKIVLIEETEELLKSDLIHYVYPFKMNILSDCINAIKNILSHYDIIQKEIIGKNPREFIKRNYNFANNVKKLLNL